MNSFCLNCNCIVQFYDDNGINWIPIKKSMESNGMKAFACENWSVRFSHSVANEKRRTSEQ